jgi:hypothetical protein
VPLLGGARRLGGRGSLAARGAAGGDGLGGAKIPCRPWSWRRKEGNKLGAMRGSLGRERDGGKWDLG